MEIYFNLSYKFSFHMIDDRSTFAPNTGSLKMFTKKHNLFEYLILRLEQLLMSYSEREKAWVGISQSKLENL